MSRRSSFTRAVTGVPGSPETSPLPLVFTIAGVAPATGAATYAPSCSVSSTMSTPAGVGPNATPPGPTPIRIVCPG